MYKPHYTIAKGITASCLVFIAQTIIAVATSQNFEIMSVSVGSLLVGAATALINYAKHRK